MDYDFDDNDFDNGDFDNDYEEDMFDDMSDDVDFLDNESDLIVEHQDDAESVQSTGSDLDAEDLAFALGLGEEIAEERRDLRKERNKTKRATYPVEPKIP